MSYIRIKTIKGKQYAYRQTSVRKGKKVKTILEYLGAIAMAPLIGVALATGCGKRSGSAGPRPTDKRQILDQEKADRELFHKDRAMFNVKQRQDYERQQRGRDAATEARDAANKTEEEVMEAAKEFNAGREKEKEPPGPSKQL